MNYLKMNFRSLLLNNVIAELITKFGRNGGE